MRHFIFTMIEDKGAIDRLDTFFKALTKKDKIAVLHDADPDGICSAVLVARTVMKLRKKNVDLHKDLAGRHSLSPELLSLLKAKQISKIISTDVSIDQDIKGLKALIRIRVTSP